MSDPKAAQEFLTRLTGREGARPADLSSAQRARFLAWCAANRVNPDTLDTASASAPAAPAPRPAATGARAAFGAIGTDIQDIDELFPEEIADLKSAPDLAGIFTQKELAYAESRPDPYATLAGLFAAKEAIVKCDGAERPLASIEITHEETGKPVTEGYLISISHTKRTAFAVALAAADPAPVPEPPAPATAPEPAAAPQPAPAKLSGTGLLLVGIAIAAAALYIFVGVS